MRQWLELTSLNQKVNDMKQKLLNGQVSGRVVGNSSMTHLSSL